MAKWASGENRFWVQTSPGSNETLFQIIGDIYLNCKEDN